MAAATQQRDPSHDIISAPPAAGAGGYDWVLLDPRAVTGGFNTGSAAPSPTAAASVASNGRIVRVSLQLEPPPGVSYVEIASGDPFIDNPTVAAADGDLLLIDMGFDSFRDEDDHESPPWIHVDDLFVYTADPERPSLRRLPARPSNHTNGNLYAGIVRGGDGEFVVADLQTRIENLEGGACWYVTELLRYSSVADKWEVRRIDMPADEDEISVRTSTWETDAAFSSGGLVYWADYHRGVLSCDVAAAAADLELRFVACFPRTNGPLDEDFRYGDRAYPERHRKASVDGDGVLWFVDVDDTRDSTGEWGSVEITTWSMRTPELGWVEERTLELDDDVAVPPIWRNDDEWEWDRVRVERLTPTFPVVSVLEDDVVHFVVRVDAERWMATVDMRSRSFRSCEMLQKALKGPQESDDDGDRLVYAMKEILGDAPLIWCEVGKYASP